MSAHDDEVAKVAYELYEKSGWAQGKDLEHWLEAERIVAEREKSQKVSRPKPVKTVKPAKKPGKTSPKKTAAKK